MVKGSNTLLCTHLIQAICGIPTSAEVVSSVVVLYRSV